MKNTRFFILVFGGLIVSLAMCAAWLHCSTRYTLQTVTFKTTTYTNTEMDWKVCLKFDRLTGRTWILEGSNVKEHHDMYFREIFSR